MLIKEAYGFNRHALVTSSYYYGLFSLTPSPEKEVFSADNYPHHRDIPTFPHHFHDERGRVREFSGELRAFCDSVDRYLISRYG